MVHGFKAIRQAALTRLNLKAVPAKIQPNAFRFYPAQHLGMSLVGKHARSWDASQVAGDCLQLARAQLNGAPSTQLTEDRFRPHRLIEEEPGSPQHPPKAFHPDENLGVPQSGRRSGRRDPLRLVIRDTALTTTAELGEHPRSCRRNPAWLFDLL
ncbi:hypothetical protein ACFW9F_09480 [Streptomyces sp. NPDC059506]|uniref:hypothetical protein n=1 Tax=Streptomyces sp. NPDC059506 TaxID=3347751 RepID=UPI0036CE0A62